MMFWKRKRELGFLSFASRPVHLNHWKRCEVVVNRNRENTRNPPSLVPPCLNSTRNNNLWERLDCRSDACGGLPRADCAAVQHAPLHAGQKGPRKMWSLELSKQQRTERCTERCTKSLVRAWLAFWSAEYSVSSLSAQVNPA